MTIKIGEGEYEYTRPLLKKWLSLEEIRDKLNKAVDAHEADSVAMHMTSFVSTALSIQIPDDCAWYEVGIGYVSIALTNLPKYDIPFLSSKVKERKDNWDYEGRSWYIWAHLFSKEYGWNLSTIENLDVDDAICLTQEIALEEQLNKEWDWMLSEVPYQSKDGFKPLPRPDWMLYSKKAPIIEKIKIRKDMMPVGNIIRYQAPKSNESTQTL